MTLQELLIEEVGFIVIPHFLVVHSQHIRKTKPTSRTGKHNSKHKLPKNTEPVKPDAILKRKHAAKQPTVPKPASQTSAQK